MRICTSVLIPVFDQIAETASDPVLIIGHAGVNRMILCHVLGMPIRKLFSNPPGLWSPESDRQLRERTSGGCS